MKTVWDNVEHFEELIAEFAGSDYAVAVDSCTNALFLSIKYFQALGHHVAPGVLSRIQVPNRTYISVPMQIKHAGFDVDFHDGYWSGAYRLAPLPVIDSAQRFTENMYENYSGCLYCLSFHSKKILSIGRGGMILTDDKNARDWLKRSRYDGRSSIYYNDIDDRSVPTLGWHMYMTPEEAVRGIEQFYKTPKYNEDSGCCDDYAIDLSTLKCFR
jgi:dTDP-4-amino-4,6-dideoxygalactose transaminase